MKIRKLITVFVIAIFLMFLVPNLSILKADGNLVIKQFTINAYGIFDTTPTQYAELYDMTEAGGSTNVVAGIAAAKAIKPSLVALRYWNMRSVVNTGWLSTVYAQCVANNWFLKDAGGNPVACDVGYLVDIGSSSYQSYIANILNGHLTSYGYDGIFADWGMPYGPGELFYGAKATPINPRTGNPWTGREVRNAVVSFHVTLKNVIGSKLLCCNGIFEAYRFYAYQSEHQQILSASPMDGFMSESLWHPYVHSTPCIWMSETRWQQAVQFLIWVQDNWLAGHPNRFYVPVVKLAFGNQVHTPRPSGATRQQMAMYGYASTLLGIKQSVANQVYFSSFADTSFITQYLKTVFDANIGIPTGDCYMIGGTHVYARDFSNGKVLVNPTDFSYSVNLGSTRFVNAATGQSVPQTITIPPHTGGVLTVETGPSPSPSRAPSISLWTEKTTYARGQTLNVYIQAFNPASAQPVKLNIWFGLPGGGKYAYGTYYTGTIPAAYTSPVYTWKSSKIPTSAAAGTYSVNAEIRDPSTNALIDSDTYYFAIN